MLLKSLLSRILAEQNSLEWLVSLGALSRPFKCMFFALLSTHMFPCNKTLRIVNVPQPNYMYCNHKFLCMWLYLGSRSRSPSYMYVQLLYPNIFCAKFAMHKKKHGNLKWTLEYLKPNELYCGSEFIEKVLTIFMSYLQVVWCMMLLKHAKWNLRVHFFSSSHCYAQSNIWNTLIWFTPLTIYVPKKIHKLLNKIFGPFAILVLIVLRV